MKRANLPPTIGKLFVRPNCALTYLVNVVRRFRFSKKFRAAAILSSLQKASWRANSLSWLGTGLVVLFELTRTSTATSLKPALDGRARSNFTLPFHMFITSRIGRLAI